MGKNNQSIQVLRGKNNTDNERSAFNTAKANLLDGQPLFDKKNNYLYIGNKDDSSSIKPITSDRIKGDGYEISSDTDNLNITTTNDIKIQSGSDSSNPLVIETDSSNGLVKIKKENDDTTKSTAQLGVGFIHLPDIDGAPINTNLPKVIDSGIIRSINGLAVGDDTFLFDCDTPGTLALMQNGGDRAQTAIRFYGQYNNSNIPINDPSQGLPYGNIIFENSRFKIDQVTDIHRRCDIYSTSASGENQVNVMMPSKDPLHPDDSGAYNIRLFYNTDGRRGLYDRKLDSTFILINGNDSVKFTGNLDGNADTATTATNYNTSSGNIKNKFGTIVDNTNAPLYNYNTSKGTIESRLQSLGFKQATISGVDANFINGLEGYQQGKIVAAYIDFITPTNNPSTTYKDKQVIARLSNIDTPLWTTGVWECYRTKSGPQGVLFHYIWHYTWELDNTITVYYSNPSSAPSYHPGIAEVGAITRIPVVMNMADGHQNVYYFNSY